MNEELNIKQKIDFNQLKIKLKEHYLGIILIVLGLIELVIGILSWKLTIPIFSSFYFGELIGIVFIIMGFKRIFGKKEQK